MITFHKTLRGTESIHIEGYTVRTYRHSKGSQEKETKGENGKMSMRYAVKADIRQVGSHMWNTSECKVTINRE